MNTDVECFAEDLVPSIRTATRADAGQLAQLAEATFREAFGAVNSAADMDLHCRSSYGESIQSAELSDPSMATLLCEQGQRLIGYAQLRWATAPDCVKAARPGEIQRLYVASDWHGKGVAQDLMNTGFDVMRTRHSDVVWLGVWERNPRAIAFYEKLGFAAVGEHEFRLGNDPQRDIVMARPVPGSPKRT
jgi:ribosomal protein S18 acetylase RimI-like enzyme